MNQIPIPFTKPIIPIVSTVKRLDVYDPAMCCSSGICGPDVDPKLVQFASDVAWLKSKGVPVARHNLSQDPATFVASELVRSKLTERGEAALPLLVSGGKLVVAGRYPERAELAAWYGFSTPVTKATEESGCCGGSSCC